MFCGAHDALGDRHNTDYVCDQSIAASMGLACGIQSTDGASKKQIVDKGHHLLQDDPGNHEL